MLRGNFIHPTSVVPLFVDSLSLGKKEALISTLIYFNVVPYLGEDYIEEAMVRETQEIKRVTQCWLIICNWDTLICGAGKRRETNFRDERNKRGENFLPSDKQRDDQVVAFHWSRGNDQTSVIHMSATYCYNLPLPLNACRPQKTRRGYYQHLEVLTEQ